MSSVIRGPKPLVWHVVKFCFVLLVLGAIFVLKGPLFSSGNAANDWDSSNTQENLRKDSFQESTATTTFGYNKQQMEDSSPIDSFLIHQHHSSYPYHRKLLSIQQEATNSTPMVAFAAGMHPEGESILGDGDDDEDDGNTPICHRLPLYPYDKCQYAQENCMSPLAGGILNYLQLRYCTLTWAPLFYLLMGVWLFILFFLLGDTAEAYFCPSLTEISRLLRLSPDVSGVTLLAFGNGAPDIASIIAGVIGGSAGFGLGEPIGAGLFVTTAVFSAVTLLSSVKVDAVPFIRDVGTCLIGVTFCFIVFLTGKFELWQSLTCLALYAFYVSFVVIGKHVYSGARRLRFILRQRASQKEEKRPLLSPSQQTSYGNGPEDSTVRGIWKSGKEPLWNEVVRAGKLNENVVEKYRDGQPLYASHYYPKIGIAYKVASDDRMRVIHVDEIQSAAQHQSINAPEESEGPIRVETDVSDSTDQEDLLGNEEARHRGSLLIEDYFAPRERLPRDDDNFSNQFFIARLYQEFKEWINWEEMSTVDRIQFVLASPSTFIRNLTIPKADKEEWSKLFACLTPIFMPWFALWAMGYPLLMVGGVIPLGVPLTIAGCIIAVCIFFTSQRGKAPIYHPILVVASFIMGIIWIYILANELVDVLQSVGILWQVSDAILAVTVLTWGNSLGDMVADVVVARSGFPDMACAAIFGGPTLNLLIGIGLSVSYHCISEGHAFPLEHEPTVFLSFIMLMMSLVGSLIVIPLSGFKSPNHYGVLLLALYAFFMVVAVCMELGFLFPPLK